MGWWEEDSNGIHYIEREEDLYVTDHTFIGLVTHLEGGGDFMYSDGKRVSGFAHTDRTVGERGLYNVISNRPFSSATVLFCDSPSSFNLARASRCERISISVPVSDGVALEATLFPYNTGCVGPLSSITGCGRIGIAAAWGIIRPPRLPWSIDLT
jgi:hypothetical protein